MPKISVKLSEMKFTIILEGQKLLMKKKIKNFKVMCYFHNLDIMIKYANENAQIISDEVRKKAKTLK